MLARLDVVVASVHSKLRMDARHDDPADGRPPSPNPHIDILGHCTGRLVDGRPRHPPGVEFDAEVGLRGLRRSSTSPSRSTAGPSVSTRRPGCSSSRSRRAACSPSTPTRTRPGQLEWQAYGCERAEAAGIDPTGSSTPGRKDRLLAWANL